MKKLKKYLILLIIITGVGIALSLTMTFAKYVKDIFWENHLKSQGFYFTSLELDVKNKNNIISPWENDYFDFTLLSSDKDAITEYDINYDASCRVMGEAALYTECFLNNEETSEITGTLTAYEACFNETLDEVDATNFNKSECELGGYLWKQSVSKALIEVHLVSDEIVSEVKVRIEVKSTTPYTKTLTGDFTLYKKDKDDYVVKYYDYENHGDLIITNKLDIDKCSSFKWDSNLLVIDENLDNYQKYNVDEEGYINNIELISPKNKTTILKFYKKGKSNIKIEDFNFNECTLKIE